MRGQSLWGSSGGVGLALQPPLTKGATGPGVGSSATITELYITFRAPTPLATILPPIRVLLEALCTQTSFISLINLLHGTV